jgi:hypothetical protein
MTKIGVQSDTDPLSNEELLEEWERREDLGYGALKMAAAHFVNVLARYPWLWGLGDGCGGSVLCEIVETAARRGFDVQYTGDCPTNLERILGERDGWNCRYCGVLLAGGPEAPYPQVDHVIPKSKGGSDGTDNRVLACPPCNSSKGAKSVEEFLAYQAERRTR